MGKTARAARSAQANLARFSTGYRNLEYRAMTDIHHPPGDMSAQSTPLPYARREAPPPLDWNGIMRQAAFLDRRRTGIRRVGLRLRRLVRQGCVSRRRHRDVPCRTDLPFPGRVGRLRPQ